MANLIPTEATDFPDLGTPISDTVNAFVTWLVTTAGDFFNAVSEILLQRLLLPVENILRDAPPWAVLLVLAVLAFAASRRVVLTLFIVAATWFVGALQLWDEAMQTMSIMIIAVLMAVVIGLPVGIVSSRSNRIRIVVNAILDVAQTIPVFVYLIPVAMLFGLGKVAAIIATVTYAMPPLIRLTDLGLREVDRRMTEAGRAFGATQRQILTGIQFPLALPTIMQGLNQAILLALSMVVVASLIGTRGLGEIVLVGLRRGDVGTGLTAGIAIVVLAIILDRITQATGRRFQTHRAVRN